MYSRTPGGTRTTGWMPLVCGIMSPSKPNSLYLKYNFFYSVLNKSVISSDHDKWDMLYTNSLYFSTCTCKWSSLFKLMRWCSVIGLLLITALGKIMNERCTPRSLFSSYLKQLRRMKWIWRDAKESCILRSFVSLGAGIAQSIRPLGCWLTLNGQLHASAALLPGIDPLYPMWIGLAGLQTRSGCCGE
jgi:hypothetical protein